MAKVLSYDQLTEYLRTCFEIEKTIYIQQETISKMNAQYNQLGRERKISMPQKPETYYSSGDVDALCIGIFAIILAILCFTIIPQATSIAGFFKAIVKLAIGSVIAVAFIPIYCAIKGSIETKEKEQRLNERYQTELREYDKAVQKDKERVANELLQKNLLSIQIRQLKVKMQESKETRKKIYSCNVLEESYQGLIPVAYIYQYLKVGKTLGLRFNPSTGDTGAYNLYDNDRRLDRIISQNDIIINNLEKLYDTVLSLKSDIVNMNIKINSLSSNFRQFSNQALKSINQIEAHSAVTEYNSECTRREMEFSNTMHALGLWY
ncbi:MAG: hypothetical protein UE295_03500 [Acutalibacteraceae bacterium]|nr:hypothetical protein [Acutalibacteraceae bacterium]MEE0264055.1 hypothetical protein [Acutalibacteraceae bacterium]